MFRLTKAKEKREEDGAVIEIETLRRMNQPKRIVLTRHARERLTERNIMIADIIKGIETGEIIKQYEDDKPLPSCLILGHSTDDLYIHIVVSHDEEYIYLITAYRPNMEHWEKDFKTRRGH